MRPRHPAIGKRGTCRERGLTLIEMMVSLSIGMLIILGAMTLLSNTSLSFRLQDDYARLQDNGTFALRYLGEDLRMAGFMGLYAAETTAASAAHPVLAGGAAGGVASDCGGAPWALDARLGLIGYGGLTAAAVNGVLACIPAVNFQDGSSVLVVRRADGVIVNRNAAGQVINVPGGVLGANTVYAQSGITTAIAFLGADFAGLPATDRKYISGPAGTLDAPVYEYKAHVYYLRPCSRPTGGGGLCQAGDDGGRPIPTLVRRQLSTDAPLRMIEQPLAEGVERFVVLFGVDVLGPTGAAGRDGVAERYVLPDASGNLPAGQTWDQVVSARVVVLVRSTQPLPGYDDSERAYDLDGDGVADFICTAGVDCGFRRQIYSQTYQVRNIAYRRSL